MGELRGGVTADAAAAVAKVVDSLRCSRAVGYIRLIHLGGGWVPLDVHFGLPLFDARLNEAICQRAERVGTFRAATELRRHVRETRELALRLLTFVASYHAGAPAGAELAAFPVPSESLLFENGALAMLH